MLVLTRAELTYLSNRSVEWSLYTVNYKLQLFMKMKKLNFDQCGKNFATGCNFNDHEIDL